MGKILYCLSVYVPVRRRNRYREPIEQSFAEVSPVQFVTELVEVVL